MNTDRGTYMDPHTMEIVCDRLAERVRQIALFCLVHRGRCFARMDASLVFRYVAFHLLCGTAFVQRDHAGGIKMVAFAWRSDAAEILRRDAANEPQFAWQLPRKDGDAVLITQVIGQRRWMPQLLSQVMAHWPDSPRLHLFTYRSRCSSTATESRLKELTWTTIKRFTYGRLAKDT